MRMTVADYAHFQVIMAILCSLAFLPVGLLAGRFGGRAAARASAAILMLNPLFVQNATYPWTKLQAAFFILTGLYFFLRVRDGDRQPGRAAVVCALALGGAVLTHYSAGPYVVAFAAAWIATGWRRGWDRAFARMTAARRARGRLRHRPLVCLVGRRVRLARHVPLQLQRPPLDAAAPGNPLVTWRSTCATRLIPPQVRGFRGTLFRQTSPWGALRDQFFLLYQLNPLLALGCVGWIAVVAGGAAGGRGGRRATGFSGHCALCGFVAASFAVVRGPRSLRDRPHICLQSLVLLGLAFLASRWGRLGRGWRWALIAGWAVDFCLGIALQFAVEDFAIDRWLSPARGLPEVSGPTRASPRRTCLRKSSPISPIFPTFCRLLPRSCWRSWPQSSAWPCCAPAGRPLSADRRNDRFQTHRRHRDPRVQRGARPSRAFSRLEALFRAIPTARGGRSS